jgi:hypothetical protein
LEHLSNMTRDQKEQYVLELYQKGNTIRQIAKMIHMSFRDIGAITKKHKKEIERKNEPPKERTHNKPKSKVTQAVKLFSEGKNLVDVAIALDLPPDKVQDMHRQFLQLKNMDELVKVYDEIQNYLSSFLELFRIFHDRGLGRSEILEIIGVIVTGELPYMQEKADYLRGKVKWLENEVRRNEHKLTNLIERIKELSYEGRIIPMAKTTNELAMAVTGQILISIVVATYFFGNTTNFLVCSIPVIGIFSDLRRPIWAKTDA